MLKAYFVWVAWEWGDYFHAESASKAKAAFWKVWSTEAEDYLNLRPIRTSWLDGIPITPESIAAGIDPKDADDWGVKDWTPECPCLVCRPEA